MLIYNYSAFFAIVTGLALGFGGYSLTRNVNIAIVTGIISVAGFDLISRLRNETEEVPILAPDAGGHIWFVPMWVYSIVGFIIWGVMWMEWV